MFKPLIIPRKLQQALPYKDKPKYGVRGSEQKKSIDRVAVIKEPQEQKVRITITHYLQLFIFFFFVYQVSSMIKRIKATYEHKQQQLKAQTKERLEKHRQMVEAVQNKRARKLQAQKKEVFRAKSKAQIREEKKGSKRKNK